MSSQHTISGVETSALTEEVWTGVAEAYCRSAYQYSDDESIPKSRYFNTTADDVLYGYNEHRLGSVITFHSKLVVCRFTRNVLHFSFHANADKYELEYAETQLGVAESSINDDMQQRITAFLTELGVVREIVSCIDLL